MSAAVSARLIVSRSRISPPNLLQASPQRQERPRTHSRQDASIDGAKVERPTQKAHLKHAVISSSPKSMGNQRSRLIPRRSNAMRNGTACGAYASPPRRAVARRGSPQIIDEPIGRWCNCQAVFKRHVASRPVRIGDPPPETTNCAVNRHLERSGPLRLRRHPATAIHRRRLESRRRPLSRLHDPTRPQSVKD